MYQKFYYDFIYLEHLENGRHGVRMNIVERWRRSVYGVYFGCFDGWKLFVVWWEIVFKVFVDTTKIFVLRNKRIFVYLSAWNKYMFEH